MPEDFVFNFLKNILLCFLNNNISKDDIEGIIYALGLELIIYNKNGIRYLHSSGKLTQDFPTEITTLGTIPNVIYKGYGTISSFSSGTIIKISYVNGVLNGSAAGKLKQNESVQDGCVLV